MQLHDLGRGQAGQARLEVDALPLQVIHPCLDQGAGQKALLHLVQEAGGAPGDFLQLALDRGPGRAISVALLALELLEFADGRLDDGWVQEVLLDGRQYSRLDVVHLRSSAIGAEGRPLLLAGDALKAAAGSGEGHGAVAAAAAHKPGEQPLRALGPLGHVGHCQLGVARLDGRPEGVVDQLQVRDRRANDAVLGALSGAPGPGAAVLDVAVPAPDQLAGVEGVMQDAVAALGVAVDGGRIPGATSRRAHALDVQLGGDGPGRDAGHILPHDPPDDVGLLGLDVQQAGQDLAAFVKLAPATVAIDAAAGVAAVARDAIEAAAGLVRDGLDLQGAHCAQHANLHRGHLAVGDGVDDHAQDLQVIVHIPGAAAAPIEAVHVFDDDQLEAAGGGLGHQLLEAGPGDLRRSGDGRVVEFPHYGRADTRGITPAIMQLVLDGSGLLHVGRVTSVKRGAHGY